MTSKANAEKKDDRDSAPMFSLKRLDWEKRLSKLQNKGKTRYIQKVATSSNILLIGVSGGYLIRWKLNDLSKEPEEIEISTRNDDAIEHIFVDAAGFHVILSFKSGDAFYLHSKALKPKKLSKFQGNVESVAFDRTGVSENSTKSMLVGTSLGCLYEVILESTGKEKLFQLIHQINPPIPINSVFFETVMPGGTTGEMLSAASDRQYILFSTDSPTRLYHLVGGGSLYQIFHEYNQGSEIPFIELPGEIHRAALLCYAKNPSARAETFALLTGAGIYHGSLREIRTGSENLLTETHILPFVEPATRNPNFQYEIEGVSRKPISISVAIFHFILLRGDRLQFLSSLNGDLIQEELFRSADGIPIDLVRDPTRNISYLYTNGAIFQILVHEEDRDVWSTFLTKALATGDDSLFDLAFEHSKSAERKSIVTKARAEFYFKEQKFDKAAVYYAHSGLNFEEVTLKLLSVNENFAGLERSSLQSRAETDTSLLQGNGIWLSNRVNLAPVRIYLLELLKLLPASSKSQRTILCTWLCEIFLHEITEINLSGPGAGKGRQDLSSDFCLFLKANKNSLDFATVLQLIINRNNRKLLLFYAKIMGDYHRVINMLLTEKRYDEALAVVQDAPFEKISNFIYKIVPIFFETVPERTVNIILAKGNFQIPNLVPAILRYCTKFDEHYYSKQSTADTNFAVMCLEEFLKRAGLNFENCPERIDISVHDEGVDLTENVNVDEWVKSETEAIAIHLMCHLYAKYDEHKTERKLINFLHTLLNLQELCVLSEFVEVDFEYMLRQCRIYHRKRGAVYCLLLLKEFKQAVTEALLVDIDLAKAVTRRQEDAILRKDLWIMIAIHLVNTESDVKRVVSLVKESNEDILIEDLLSFLPDFTEIDNFRDDICRSLEACSSRINNVKADMQHLLETAENTMQELESMKNRGYSTRTNHERCDLCSDGLMGNQFYLFPCSHGFHGSCLLKEAYKALTPDQLVTLKSLEDSLKTLALRGKDLDNRSRAQQEALQQEVDGYIAADCPLCGYIMINSISSSLISQDESQQAKLWSL